MLCTQHTAFFFSFVSLFNMPPIRTLDDAFLAQLLKQDVDIRDVALDSNIDSASLSSVLKKLETTSNALQQEIFNKVNKNFDEFSSLYNESQSIHWRVLELAENVSNAEKTVHDASIETHSTIDHYKQSVLASERNQAKINTLEKIKDSLQQLDTIHDLLKQSNYLTVVDELSQLSALLQNWTDGDVRIINILTERLSQTKQTLITQLQDAISTAIQFNMGSVRILETFQSSSNTSIHVHDILRCMYQLNILPDELMRVERSMFKSIFHPFFNNIKSTLQMDKVQVGPNSQGGVLQVIQHQTSDEETASMDPVKMIQQVDSILEFFYSHLFSKEDDKDIKHLFGNLLSPELFELMINQSIQPAIPSSKEHLADFDRVAETVTTFETRCRDMYGFQLDNENNTLGAYVSHIDKHYAKKRCERMLQQGRKVMMRRLYDTDAAHVTEGGHTYRFQITQTPQILLVLISDTLSEAADLLASHPISAATLIHGVRDLLDMYRAIMPRYHRAQYLSSAANTLVFRNDCLWLSHQLRLDKEVVKKFDGFEQDLNEASKRLGELGKAWHELAMMQCLQMIHHALEPLDGFLGMSENAKFQQDCDRAVGQVVQVVLSFASTIRPVVDETLFLDMLGRIVDSVLTGFITDIESLVDIGAEESHIIAVNLNSLAQLVSAFDLPDKDATEGFVMELVPNWEKFWLVKDILEMNMREIMEFYRHGKLHMFEKTELVGLLCSLFADTDLREANIEEIKSGRIVQESMDRSIPQPTTASAAPMHESTPPISSSINHGLEYQPDDEEEMGDGWGDDGDDLFLNDLISSPVGPVSDIAEQHQQEKEPSKNRSISQDTTTTTIMSPATASSIHHGLEYQPDEDMDEIGDGWGDDDDDLFGDDIKP